MGRLDKTGYVQVTLQMIRLSDQARWVSARRAVAEITRMFTPYMHERTVWRILKTTGTVEPVDPDQVSLL